MKNDNKIVKFTIFVLLLTIVALYLVSGTYAKYTSEFAGSDKAIVAKWVVSDDDVEKNINIFDVSKIYDTNGETAYTVNAGTDDTDVVNGTDKGIIAPGTWGSFTYIVSNDSDVNATYAVDYTVDEAGVPLEWSVNGQDWTDDLSDVSTTALNMEADDTVTVYWRWVFEETTIATKSDTTDTALGLAETLAEPSINVKTTFTQVD